MVRACHTGGDSAQDARSACVRCALDPTPLARPCHDVFFFSSRRRHTRSTRDWSSDVCSSDLAGAVSQLLNEATQRIARSSKGPFSAKRSVATAQMFMDLILLPMLMRSLMGEELKDLRKELPAFLHERVNFFLAACEADWRP